jgi:competence protein ComFC
MIFDLIGDILFPPACLGCAAAIRVGALCDQCLASVDLFQTLFCGTCSARLPDQKKICHKDAPYLLGAAGSYDDTVLQSLIHALKFQGIKSAAKPLAQILAEYVVRLALPVKDFVVVPIPLSKKRLRSRGFNQAEIIARSFSESLGVPLVTNLLVRQQHRKPQSETTSLLERLENVIGCFSVAPGFEFEIDRKGILLVDDVITSGTTFTEAAKVLKQAGAKKIMALAVAKA